MTAIDDQVAALRAQLAGDHDEHRRLLAGLHASGALDGYSALITAAFIDAVDRRFGPGQGDDAAVAAFVDDVQARFPGAEGEFGRDDAVRVIARALGRGSVRDIDGGSVRRIERLLLPVMVTDERLSGAELDRFLGGARELLDS